VSNHDERDATWETEAYLKDIYSDFYKEWLVTPKSRDKILLRGESCNTPGVKHAFALAFHEHKHHLCIHEHHMK
jgi:hypothetical protein